MKNSITLNDTEIKLISKNGQQWMTAADLAKALGYKSTDAVSKIYKRHKDEFPNDMKGVVNLSTPGGKQEKIVFSLRGAHLIAMLGHTAKAKTFRKAVLDLIEQEQQRQENKRVKQRVAAQKQIEDLRARQLQLEDKTKQTKSVPFARLSTPEAIEPGAEIATNFACIREVKSADIGVQTETAFHQTMVFVSNLIRDNRRLEQENETLKQAFKILKH